MWSSSSSDQSTSTSNATWFGEWAEARELARDRHNEHTAEYLLGMPLLADYLQAGLDVFGISCEEIEEERL
jgi:hypothetical protein